MSKGGARWGAGRPATKAKAELVHRVDVREWARRGLLDSPGWFSWSWNRAGEPAGAITFVVDPPHGVTLRYGYTVNEQTSDIAQRVNLTRTACHYGGARPWFVCPCCARRVAVLYLRWRRFACRHCQRVAHSSQSDDAFARLTRKVGKIEARLGDTWQRPKGMRRRTFSRLLAEMVSLEDRQEAALSVFLERLVSHR